MCFLNPRAGLLMKSLEVPALEEPLKCTLSFPLPDSPSTQLLLPQSRQTEPGPAPKSRNFVTLASDFARCTLLVWSLVLRCRSPRLALKGKSRKERAGRFTGTLAKEQHWFGLERAHSISSKLRTFGLFVCLNKRRRSKRPRHTDPMIPSANREGTKAVAGQET
jgi:hypothetical protein